MWSENSTLVLHIPNQYCCGLHTWPFEQKRVPFKTIFCGVKTAKTFIETTRWQSFRRRKLSTGRGKAAIILRAVGASKKNSTRTYIHNSSRYSLELNRVSAWGQPFVETTHVPDIVQPIIFTSAAVVYSRLNSHIEDDSTPSIIVLHSAVYPGTKGLYGCCKTAVHTP